MAIQSVALHASSSIRTEVRSETSSAQAARDDRAQACGRRYSEPRSQRCPLSLQFLHSIDLSDSSGWHPIRGLVRCQLSLGEGTYFSSGLSLLYRGGLPPPVSDGHEKVD